jgi:hypothetical protein
MKGRRGRFQVRPNIFFKAEPVNYSLAMSRARNGTYMPYPCPEMHNLHKCVRIEQQNPSITEWYLRVGFMLHKFVGVV